MLIAASAVIPWIQQSRTSLRVTHRASGDLAFTVTISGACSLIAKNMVLGNMRSKRNQPTSLASLELAEGVTPKAARECAGETAASKKDGIPRAADSKTSYQDSTGTWNHAHHRCMAYANAGDRLLGKELLNCGSCGEPAELETMQRWTSNPRPKGSYAVDLRVCAKCNANLERSGKR